MSIYCPTELENNSTTTFEATWYSLEIVRNLYITADGGENGNNLTGDKFLLKTESPPRMERVEPLQPRMMGDDAVRTVRTIYSLTKGVEKVVKTMPKF